MSSYPSFSSSPPKCPFLSSISNVLPLPACLPARLLLLHSPSPHCPPFLGGGGIRDERDVKTMDNDGLFAYRGSDGSFSVLKKSSKFKKRRLREDQREERIRSLRHV